MPCCRLDLSLAECKLTRVLESSICSCVNGCPSIAGDSNRHLVQTESKQETRTAANGCPPKAGGNKQEVWCHQVRVEDFKEAGKLQEVQEDPEGMDCGASWEIHPSYPSPVSPSLLLATLSSLSHTPRPSVTRER